jgi:hypothetical protein
MAITHFSGPLGVGSGKLETVTAAKTLTMKDDNGKTFICNAAAGKTITLPPVTAAGFEAKFIIGAAFATDDWIIASVEGDNMEGAMMVASTVVDVNAADIVTLGDASAAAENIGDWVTVLSDGTYWYVDGRALTTAATTATG